MRHGDNGTHDKPPCRNGVDKRDDKRGDKRQPGKPAHSKPAGKQRPAHNKPVHKRPGKRRWHKRGRQRNEPHNDHQKPELHWQHREPHQEPQPTTNFSYFVSPKTVKWVNTDGKTHCFPSTTIILILYIEQHRIDKKNCLQCLTMLRCIRYSSHFTAMDKIYRISGFCKTSNSLNSLQNVYFSINITNVFITWEVWEK